jgi:Protein of unknown function (DUF1194)
VWRDSDPYGSARALRREKIWLCILTDARFSWSSEHTNPPGGLEKYYRDNVIGGAGAFVLVAKDFNSFGDLLIKKLIAQPRLTGGACLAGIECNSNSTGIAARRRGGRVRWCTGHSANAGGVNIFRAARFRPSQFFFTKLAWTQKRCRCANPMRGGRTDPAETTRDQEQASSDQAPQSPTTAVHRSSDIHYLKPRSFARSASLHL